MAEKLTLIQIDPTPINWNQIAIKAIDNCPKIKKEREKTILIARFGINGKPKTLQAIGNEHKITRERVRQIVNNALKKIKKYCTSEEAKKAIKLIEDIVEQNGGYVSVEQLTALIDSNNETNALRFVATLSNKIENVKISNELNEGFRNKSFKINNIKKISKEAIDFLKSKNKVTKTETISDFIKIKPAKVQAALTASNKTILTDKGWGLTSWPHINPRSIKDKSKFVLEKHGKPIHYEELTEKISQIGEKKVTKQSVHNELIKNSDFVLVGRGIYALSSWGYHPGIVEEVIVEVLAEAGEPLHRKVIVEEVLKRRIVKPSTIILNLQKPRFKKIGKAVYTLN